MPDYFAAFLDLRARRCLVAGGGAVAERKTLALLAAGARVTVVSPLLTAPLAVLAVAGRLQHRPRPFLPTDVRGCALVVAATGRESADRSVVAAARARRILTNAVDRPALCDVILPSVLQRGELQIAVSTGGRSPALAREIRRRLEPLFGPEYATLVEQAGRRRVRAHRRLATPGARARAGERIARQALGDPSRRA